MKRPSFDIESLDLDSLEWFDTETYHPPAANVWLVTRWESRVVEGLYAVSAVIWDGKKWYNADGEEVEVIEFAEVEG